MSVIQQTETQQNENLLSIRLQKLLLQMISSAQKILDKDTINSIRQKIQSEELIRQPIEYFQEFIYTLLNQIDNLQKTLDLYKNIHSKQINLQQYKNLENSLQKSQAQVRKHIRLEQQLKIYMDGIEEKNQQLENQLLNEKKTAERLQNEVKHIQLQKKDIVRKLKHIQQSLGKQQRTVSHQSSKIMSDIFLSDPASIYRTSIEKYNSKKNTNKLLLNRSHERTKKLKNSQSKQLESSIHVSINNQKKKRLLTQAEVREYTKTIELNTSKKPVRRLIKRADQPHYNPNNPYINKTRCQSGFK